MDNRKFYGFYSDGSEKLNGTIQYAGWFNESDMITFAQGLVTGLKVYCKTARVYVYEVEKIEVHNGEHPYRAIGLARVQE